MTDQSAAEGTVLQQIHVQPQQPVTSYQTHQIHYGEYSQYAGVGGTTAYYQPPSTEIDGGQTHQIITQDDHAGAAAYLVHSEALDGEGTPLSHTTRALPATVSLTVQWLIDNYETAEGVSLPRGTLYNHYLRHCHDHNMDPMNPASFGKLIRSVFLGLRTRRLGTRGNSKYHYYGIRIKATSQLNQFTDDQTMAMRQTPTSLAKRPKTFTKSEVMEHETVHGSSSMHDTTQHQHQQFLGDPSCAIPNFVKIETHEPLPEVLTQKDLDLFEMIYKEHCEAILDVVVNLQFTLVENLWRSFWRNPEVQTHADIQLEKRYPKDKLFTICKYDPVKTFIKRSDYAFYQSLVEVLIPDVLRPIPSSLTQAIRNFAKSLEGWLKTSMEIAPDDVYKAKNGAVTAFAQTLRRYTSLNHLAQAARAVLQNTSQINQMLTDLNRVDFANVQEQASWVCQCDDQIVTKFEQDFKKTLQQQNSLEQWAIWLEGVVNQVLKQQEGTSFTKSARQFLLKWSFYSSMVIRDLTLRSAASFGSFHLIRLLYDEYMFYLVEHKVAAATGETPIAVMGEVRQFVEPSTIDSLAAAAAAAIPTPEARHSTNHNSNQTMTTQQHMPTMVTVTGSHGDSVPVTMVKTGRSGEMQTIPVSLSTGDGRQLMSVGGQSMQLMTTSSGPGAPKTIVVVPVSATTGEIIQPAIKKQKTSN